MTENQIIISGTLIAIDALRYSPAGIPVLNFKIQHESDQVEAGVNRHIKCELPVQALGQNAQMIAAAQVGESITIEGFLAAKSRNVARTVLHVNKVKFRGKSHEKTDEKP